MSDVVDDVVFLTLHIRGRYYAHGFVENDVDMHLFGLSDQFSIDSYLILWKNFGSQFGKFSIDGDSVFFQKFVCCPSRAEAHLAEVFVDTNRRILGHGKKKMDLTGNLPDQIEHVASATY